MVSIRSSAPRERRNRALRNGLGVLRLLACSPRTLGITEIARELLLSKSSAHDLLASLGDLGLVEKNDVTKRYAVSASYHDFFGVTDAMNDNATARTTPPVGVNTNAD
jgi:DNA-binding IclR family transcriptional regulator